MALNLITGYAGIPHITSENDGAVNAALYGSERYVLNTGQKFAYEIISNNLIRIKDGYAMNQGRKIGLAISEYEDLTIDNGLQGVKRSDIIVIRYTKNLDTGIESADFVVVKGTSGDAYKDPALETGNIIQGDSVDDLPLYRVKIDGLSIAAVEPMFNVLMSMQEMQDEIASNASAIDSLDSKSAWKKIGNGSYLGPFSISIPASAKEILIMATQNASDSFPHASAVIPIAGGSNYNISVSFYYDASYFLNVTYNIGDNIKPVSNWTIGKNGSTSLSLSVIRTYLYYR